MVKEDELVGVVVIYRQEVKPFTIRQVELVSNFAAQAVIAIENARLLNELRQSLEQQTATSEVLRIISSSSGDLQPVFTAVLENAVRICGAWFGNLALFDGREMRIVATHNAPPSLEKLRRERPVSLPLARTLADRSCSLGCIYNEHAADGHRARQPQRRPTQRPAAYDRRSTGGFNTWS